MADIVTLDDLRATLGYADDEHGHDAQLTAAIPGAIAAVNQYTGRSFGAAEVTEQRKYQYDNTGFLEIDDAVPDSITEVSVGGYVIQPNGYIVGPGGVAERVEWLELPLWGGISGQMGFTYNFDQLIWKYPQLANVVAVTATFGYASPPADVLLAIKLTAIALALNPQGYDLRSVAGTSASFGTAAHGSSSGLAEAIPLRAQGLLYSHVKVRL